MPTEQSSANRQLARDIRSSAEGIIVGSDLPGSRGHYWLQPIEGGKEWPVPKEFVLILGDLAKPPTYWLRQRNGAPGGQHLNADEAAMVAARSGAVGDYLSPVGLTWSEPDPAGPGGFSYYTLTPIWETGAPS